MPVVGSKWLGPHAHVTCVKELEFDPARLNASALTVVHTFIDRPANYIVSENAIYDHDPQQGISAELQKARGGRSASKVDLTRCAELGELVIG